MLRTRLWVGTLLMFGGLAILIVDEALAPWYPGWLLMVLGLGLVACYELQQLFRTAYNFISWLSFVGVAVLLGINWLAHLPVAGWPNLDPWHCLLFGLVAYLLLLCLVEMAFYLHPGEVMTRMSLSFWTVAYLGVLPSFMVQLRWLPTENHQGTVALIMVIFVPKCCDIGAYFTGRWFGRTRMTPVLSPKKTWEGALGGLTLAVIVTVLIDQFGPVHLLQQEWWKELGFGITVGGAGILGDLAESMIKRDCQQKDASQVVPGFGGVLDVIDAVLFAGPVAYCWFTFFGSSV